MKDIASQGADKTAQHKSAKSKSATRLSCTKCATSASKSSKHNRKVSGSSLPSSTPTLPPMPPVITTTTSQNTLPEVLTPVSLHAATHDHKFHLQLFPIDDATRVFLEKESHCPYLELTITTRKKISSVIKHLNAKWANSKGGWSQELMLFPYNARIESLESSRRWTLKDSDITAADVYESIGKPVVFRLRYGWFKSLEPTVSSFSVEPSSLPSHSTSKETIKHDVDDRKNQPSSSLTQSDGDGNLSWVDSISNMSFGALLSEAEAAESVKHTHQILQQLPINCDSFDAAIAAHLNKFPPNRSESCPLASQPFILDAEETCNPFSFSTFISSNKTTMNMQTDQKAWVEGSDMVFEGLDHLHWPPSAGPWQFAASPKQVNGDSSGFGGLD